MGYVFRGNYYKNLDFVKFIDKLDSYREIIIMGESLLVKEYIYKEIRDSVDKYVEEAIAKDFSLGEDLLFHYVFIKDTSRIYIYSIKKGIAVERVVVGAKRILVNPIQFKVKDYIEKKIKKCNNYIVIANIRGVYYLINVENGIMINGYVNEDFEKVMKELDKHGNKIKKLIVDTNINSGENLINCMDEIIYLKIGEAINGKLFK